MLSRIVVSALFAGAVTGLLAGLLQFVFLQPVLLHAELFESGALLHFGTQDSTTAFEAPAFDLVRNGLNILFSMLTYTGYALVLVAVISVAEEYGPRIDARRGMILGVAGFISFHLAPAFSLPPEVPGGAVVDVGARQIWWYATVAATALALALLAYGRNWMFWGSALILLAAPHLIGAPQPERFVGPVPPELAALYAARALGVGMAAWVTLGAAAGYFWQREVDA